MNVLYVYFSNTVHVYVDYRIDIIERGGQSIWMVKGCSRLSPTDKKPGNTMIGQYPIALTSLIEWPDGDNPIPVKKRDRDGNVVSIVPPPMEDV